MSISSDKTHSQDMPAGPRRRGYAGRTAAELSGERRQRLLETGLELFGTEGYLPTTVEKLCSHAKVTTRHFYEGGFRV